MRLLSMAIVGLLLAGAATAGTDPVPENASENALNTQKPQATPESALNGLTELPRPLPDDDTSDRVPTISIYKDWRLACGWTAQSKPNCAMATDINDPETSVKLATVTIGASKDRPSQRLAVITVPLTVLIAPGLEIRLGSVAHDYPYVTCIPSGCVAVAPMDGALAGEIASASAVGIIVVAENGKSVTLPLSLRGYSAAQREYTKRTQPAK